MMAYRESGKKFFMTKVPTMSGEWKNRGTGTRDRMTANAIDTMIEDLGPTKKAAWDILGRVTASADALPLSRLFAMWTSTPVTRWAQGTGEPFTPSVEERIAHVRAMLSAVNLSDLVTDFEKAMLSASSGIAEDTAEHYVAATRSLVPIGSALATSDLSESLIRDWLEEMDDVATGTVRKRGIGLQRFVNWLRGHGHIAHDPMANITLPPAGDPLCHYLELDDVVRLSDASVGQMRHLELILPGTAMELSVALAVRIRDISVLDKSIQAAGTKEYNRDRIVRVADFAWDAVLELRKGKVPDTRLFDLIGHRFAARDWHTETRQALVDKGHRAYAVMAGGVQHDYTLRDHRHTWAVRYARAGVPLDAIAKQLGHKDTAMVSRVYARFEPLKEERDLYERMATARDSAVAEIAKQKGKTA